MPWKKSPQELVDRFHAALPKRTQIEPKKMFGYAACFVNGNFFTGLFEDLVVIRLPGGIHGKFPELAKASGFNPMGKGAGMKDWWVIPAAIAADGGRLATLLDATFEHVVKMPAKVKKPAAAKKKSAR